MKHTDGTGSGHKDARREVRSSLKERPDARFKRPDEEKQAFRHALGQALGSKEKVVDVVDKAPRTAEGDKWPASRR